MPEKTTRGVPGDLFEHLVDSSRMVPTHETGVYSPRQKAFQHSVKDRKRTKVNPDAKSLSSPLGPNLQILYEPRQIGFLQPEHLGCCDLTAGLLEGPSDDFLAKGMHRLVVG